MKLLRDFERRGLVEQGYRTLRVVDAPGLTAFAPGRRQVDGATGETREPGDRPGVDRSRQS